MSLFSMPDIPANAPPDVRRFCEQVRTVIGTLEKIGDRVEVHQPFYVFPDDVDDNELAEFPVYRADIPVELLYATWTRPESSLMRHDLMLRWRTGDGAAAPVLLLDLRRTTVNSFDWVAFKPVRFHEVTHGRRILPGQLLTLEVDDRTTDGTTDFPTGLLSLYLRRAELI